MRSKAKRLTIGQRGQRGFSGLAGVFCLILLFFSVFLLSCRAAPPPVHLETRLPTEAPPPATAPLPDRFPAPAGGGGIVEEIRFLTEKGTPSSLLASLEIIRLRNLGSTEFGRMMNAINISLLRTLYPAIQTQFPLMDPPITHVYARILRDAENGIYRRPPPNSISYLEHVLPFLAIYPAAGVRAVEMYLAALPNLERAVRINSESVLAGYFIGLVYEQTGRLEDAYAQYSRVWNLFPESFPVALGLARIMEAQGRTQEVISFLSDLLLDFPGNIQIKRHLARTFYFSGNWVMAEAAVNDVLQQNPRDGEFILKRAHILIERGQLLQALDPLDTYASFNPSNRLYHFLRARLHAEIFNNREAALSHLRVILTSPRYDGTVNGQELWITASVYAARFLMESSRPLDQSEGRELLRRLLAEPSPSLEVVSLALDDAIRREAWPEARVFLERLLNERRSSQDLLAAFMMEREQGNRNAALVYAQELFERDRSDDKGIIAFATALIDLGRNAEAARLIDSRLNVLDGGVLKSQYYFLRSLTRTNEELVMRDLRSSLFENPRNLDALIAMFEIFHRRDDERRAVHYLRQALAISPNDPRLQRYEAQYAVIRGGMF